MFFQRLADLRVDNEKSQEEIAKYLQCQREVYRRYEKGTREIPVWALMCIRDSIITEPVQIIYWDLPIILGLTYNTKISFACL